MKINPVNFEFHIKQDDTYPPIRIKLYNTSTDEDFDLSGYTGKFYMAPIDDKETPKVDGGSVTITDAPAGEAQYNWQSGNTDTVGRFYYEFRFTSGGNIFTVPVVSPGIIVVESIIGSS